MNAPADLEVDNGPHLRQLTPLMVAARSIDGATEQTLQWLLAHGADLHARSEGGNTAAWYAAGKGGRWWFHEWRLDPDHVDRLRFLLDAGLDPREVNFIGRSLLTEACAAGDPKRVSLLLERGAPAAGFDPSEAEQRHKDAVAHWERVYVRKTSVRKALRLAKKMAEGPATALSSSEIPLFAAAKSGCAACLRLILEHGVDPNTRDKDGETASFCAGSAAVVHELVRAGADPSIRNTYGYDALREALTGDDCCADFCGARLDVARALVDVGVSIETGPGRNSTRLYDAAFSHAADAVDFLLELGADPHKTNPGGATALHAICWQGEYQDEETNAAAERIIERLIAAGIDPNVPDSHGGTPLDEAVSGDWGSSTAVRVLLKHGANADPADSSGTTPLMRAAMNGELECIRLLLDAGSDPLRKNVEGKSAVDYAREHHKTWNSIASQAFSAMSMIYDGDVLPGEREAEKANQRDARQKARDCLQLLSDAAARKRKS